MTLIKSLIDAIVLFLTNFPEFKKQYNNSKLKDNLKNAEKKFNENDDTTSYESLLK